MEAAGHALQVVVESTGASARMRPSGPLDRAHAGFFAAVLTDTYHQGPTTIEVDLSAVTTCDDAGLEVLLAAHRSVGRCGKQLRYRDAADWLVERLRGAGAAVELGLDPTRR